MAWRAILLVFLLNLTLLGSQRFAHAESDVLADFLDGAGQTLEVAGATAKDLGRTAAGTALSRAGNVASVGEAAIHAKNGNLPATIGSLVELGVGVFTVPGGAAAGTTVAPGPGTAAGAYAGSMIAKHAGNQAEKLVQDTLDKYGDKRTARQKRMEKAGLDRNAFADNYDKPLSGHMAEFNADLNRELMRLEAEQALKEGRSYYPDPALLEETAAYDRLSKQASGSYNPLALGGQSAPENSEEASANPEPDVEPDDPEETEGASEKTGSGEKQECPPELLRNVESGMREFFYTNADPNNYAIENRQEVDDWLRTCMTDANTLPSYTASDRVVVRKQCYEGYQIYKDGQLAGEQWKLGELTNELETKYNCKFSTRPQVSKDWPVPGITTASRKTFTGKRPIGAPPGISSGTSPTGQSTATADRKWTFKPPKIWVDPN